MKKTILLLIAAVLISCEKDDKRTSIPSDKDIIKLLSGDFLCYNELEKVRYYYREDGSLECSQCLQSFRSWYTNLTAGFRRVGDEEMYDTLYVEEALQDDTIATYSMYDFHIYGPEFVIGNGVLWYTRKDYKVTLDGVVIEDSPAPANVHAGGHGGHNLHNVGISLVADYNSISVPCQTSNYSGQHQIVISYRETKRCSK